MANDEIQGHLMGLERAIGELAKECARRMPGLAASLERTLMAAADAARAEVTRGTPPDWAHATADTLVSIANKAGEKE